MAYNKILIKRRTSGAAGAPGSLEGGELAMNEVNDTLYYGSAGGVIAIAGAGTFATNSLVESLTASLDSRITSEVTDLNTTIVSVSSTLDQRITDEVAALVDSAPALLNTLNELASALGDDENFAVTVSNNIAANSTKIDTVSAALTTAISNEESARGSDVAALSAAIDGQSLAQSSEMASVSAILQSNIDSEELARQTDVAALSSAIDTEALTRATADSALSTDVAALSSAIDTEALTRATADTTLQSNINAEELARQTDVAALSSAIDTEVTERQTAVSNLTTTVQSVSSTLKSDINTEKARIDAILDASDADKDSFAEIVSLINSVDTENDTAFAGYVASNNANVAYLSGAVDTEASTRAAADTTLQSNIDDEEAARIAGDAAERTYVHSNFLPLSGGDLTGGLTVTGDISASGTITGAAGLEIAGGSGDATLYVGGGMVGIGTETPNEELTVVGSISATEDIFARNGTFTGTLNVSNGVTFTSDLSGNGTSSTIFGFVLDGGEF